MQMNTFHQVSDKFHLDHVTTDRVLELKASLLAPPSRNARLIWRDWMSYPPRSRLSVCRFGGIVVLGSVCSMACDLLQRRGLRGW